jgi:hypothetical protein
MTRAQYEREKLKMARQRELDMLARLRRNADPLYVIRAAGYWLKRWQRSRSITMGRKRSAA